MLPAQGKRKQSMEHTADQPPLKRVGIDGPFLDNTSSSVKQNEEEAAAASRDICNPPPSVKQSKEEAAAASSVAFNTSPSVEQNEEATTGASELPSTSSKQMIVSQIVGSKNDTYKE